MKSDNPVRRGGGAAVPGRSEKRKNGKSKRGFENGHFVPPAKRGGGSIYNPDMKTPRYVRLGWLTLLALMLVAQAPAPPAEAPEAPTPPPESETAPPESETAPPESEDPVPESEMPADASAAPAPPAAPGSSLAALPSGSRIAIIPVDDMIYDFTLDSLRRRIERAIAGGADLIVLEIDTYGGVVTSAIEICQYLNNAQEVPVPVVAWVNSKAYSAGILIASACDEIVMSTSSATGDCAPIMPGQDLAATERAKAYSPIKTQFQDNAARHGYDPAIFHAMCVLGVQLHVIEHPDTGQRRVVNQFDYELMVNGREPSPQGFMGSIFGKGSAGANPSELDPVAREVATDADLGKWQPVETMPSGAFYAKGMIHGGSTLFTPNQTLALDIGLSKATLSNQAEIIQHYRAASATVIPQSWSENIAGFLTHPVVQGILVVALMLGAYIEFQTPGFGAGGTVAVIALIALLGAPFIIGLSDIWFVLVFLLGLVLLGIELIYTPTFGILGIVGIALMIAGLIFSAVPTGSGTLPIPPREMWDRLLQSTLWIMMGLLVGIAGMAALTRYFGQVPGLNRLILGDAQLAYAEGVPVEPIAGDETIGEGKLKVGMTGRVCSTGLHPIGVAEFDGQRIDVVSPGGWIDPGRKVRVIEVHGNRIVVDEA